MESSPEVLNPTTDLASQGGRKDLGNIDLLMDVSLRVTVELGRTRMLLKQVLELQNGSVIELDRLAGDPVDVYVNERLFARGEVVVVDDKFGVRVTELISPDSPAGAK
jgi:flagellar motor switch protein FliN/FliY